MKYTQEEIINALKIIKETCASQDECNHCPFANKFHDCRVSEYQPSEWQLNDESTEWKALI